jgi:hypothetical protein
VGTSGFAAFPTTVIDPPLVWRLRRSPRFRVRVPVVVLCLIQQAQATAALPSVTISISEEAVCRYQIHRSQQPDVKSAVPSPVSTSTMVSPPARKKSERRYTVNGRVSLGEGKIAIARKLVAAMAGALVASGGGSSSTRMGRRCRPRRSPRTTCAAT